MRRGASWVQVAAAAVGTAAALAAPATVAADAPLTADQIADTLLSSPNESVDPCVDAYEWACGGWRAANPPPPSAAYMGTFFDGVARVNAEVDSLLRAPPLASFTAGVLFASCMNTSRPELDVAPLARFGPALAALSAPNASYGAAVDAIATLAASGIDEAVFRFFVVRNFYEVGTMLVSGACPILPPPSRPLWARQRTTPKCGLRTKDVSLSGGDRLRRGAARGDTRWQLGSAGGGRRGRRV